jgi:glyoxylase-like metal-dependent hydrolase (beta-lactamase superfamily II)
VHLSRIVVCLIIVSLAAAQDAKTVVGEAVKAMGADTLKTIEYSGSGADFCLGQGFSNTSGWPKINVKNYTRWIDFEGPASRQTAIRSQPEGPVRGGCGQPINQQNQNTAIAANAPWAAKLDILLTPVGFLKIAIANDVTATFKMIGGQKFTVVSFTAENKYKVNGFINAANLVEKVETWIDHDVLGDMLVEASFTDYKDFGGVKYPTRIVQKRGSFPVLDLTISDVKPNIPLPVQNNQAKGKEKAGAGAPTPPSAADQSQKLADGVYLVTGPYQGVAVEFKDYIVAIDTPQSEARSEEIIASIKKLVPNKPIKYAVNTHSHFDHSSGIPAFVAEGATIITHRVNKAYYEKAFSAPRTLAPDKMSESKAKPKFETMTEKRVLTDGNRIVELYHVQDSPHAEGIIFAFLPKEKILVEADVFTAPPANAPTPNPLNAWHVNFADNLERLKLDYDTIVPIHAPPGGRRVTKADLMTNVGRSN